MEKQQKNVTWRSLLGKYIVDSQARDRLALAAGVQPITLIRWVKGEISPRYSNMQKLLKFLPAPWYTEILPLIAIDFPLLAQQEQLHKQVSGELPSAFFARILEANARLSQPTGRDTIRDLIFQQAIEHLDPERRGMSLTLATCVRPLEGHVVRSLREINGIGTLPWKRNLAQKPIVLGAESLAGYALTQFHRIVVPNRETPTMFPVHWTEHEQSAVAVPIALHGRLAGCLIAASALPDYFLEGQTPVLVLEHYANLCTLLIDPGDFYPSNAIRLGFMPSYEAQLPYFQNFDKAVVQQFRLAQICGNFRSLDEVHHQVWREIEEALIQDFLNVEVEQ